LHFCAAKARAMPRPMPLVEPVTMTVFMRGIPEGSDPV
jgi:hypothetical protein